MVILRWILLIFVLCIIFKNREIFETFISNNLNSSFNQNNIDNNLYMCKDNNDLPYSCHGQGVSELAYKNFSKYTSPCPKNWLLPGNSIYI